MKKLFAMILVLLMLCACGAEEEPVIEAPIIEKPIEDPTAEEFIATLPKKQQRGSKKVIKIMEEENYEIKTCSI